MKLGKWILGTVLTGLLLPAQATVVEGGFAGLLLGSDANNTLGLGVDLTGMEITGHIRYDTGLAPAESGAPGSAEYLTTGPLPQWLTVSELVISAPSLGDRPIPSPFDAYPGPPGSTDNSQQAIGFELDGSRFGLAWREGYRTSGGVDVAVALSFVLGGRSTPFPDKELPLTLDLSEFATQPTFNILAMADGLASPVVDVQAIVGLTALSLAPAGAAAASAPPVMWLLLGGLTFLRLRKAP